MTRRGGGETPKKTGRPELLTTEQAAEYLTVTAARLKSWRASGRGPVWLKLEQAVRYDRADLDAYLDAQRVS